MATAMEIFSLPSSQITRDMRCARRSSSALLWDHPFGPRRTSRLAGGREYVPRDVLRKVFRRARLMIVISKRKKKATHHNPRRRRPFPTPSVDPFQRGFGERMRE